MSNIEKLSQEMNRECAKFLQMMGYSDSEIVNIMKIDEDAVSELPKPDPINWGFNCLTQGVHHGRPEALWNVPLGYAVQIFPADALEELVISRIYQDAMQYVEQANDSNTITTPEWADKVKAFAEQYYRSTLQHKVGELSRHYNHPSYKLEIQRSAMRFRENKLSRAYEPLHFHDTINTLCRILGTKSSMKASVNA